MGAHLHEIASWAWNRKFMATVLVVVTLSIGILIGTVISGHVSATHVAAATGATPLELPNPVSLSNSFAAIVNRDEPAVVNISTTQVIDRKDQQQTPRGRGQDPFQDFFNRFFDSPNQGPEAERSLGSGMIVDKKGFILTNNHVIEQATKIQVQLNADPTLYTAKLIGADEETDLAVIKINLNRDLPIIKLGNSDGVQVGDWVLAIGSPFGLQATVTAGIISARDRGNVGRQFQHFLQTDAAINPGNSGGPLVDMAGQVVGINTAIMTGGRGYEGVGFAMPSAMAIGVYNQIIAHGKVTRGSIGVSFSEQQSSNPIVLRDLGAPFGIVIQSVEPGSPADKGGLRAGDVVTMINGRPVKTGSELVDPIAQTPIGDKVRVTYLRERQQREASVTVEDRIKIFPDRAGAQSEQPESAPGVPAVSTPEFGMEIEDLTAERARRAEYQNYHGVIVTEVAPVSFAEDIGFKRGDLIEEINHLALNSMNDYRKSLAILRPGQEAVFKVLRHSEGDGDQLLTVFLAGVIPPAEQ
jgi:serine protease Do